jgi:hypothetical protein
MATKALEGITNLAELVRSVYGDTEALKILEKLIKHPLETYALTIAVDVVNEQLNGDFSGQEGLIKALLEWYGPADSTQLH